MMAAGYQNPGARVPQDMANGVVFWERLKLMEPLPT
jgi:hypothetical protein